MGREGPGVKMDGPFSAQVGKANVNLGLLGLVVLFCFSVFNQKVRGRDLSLRHLSYPRST